MIISRRDGPRTVLVVASGLCLSKIIRHSIREKRKKKIEKKGGPAKLLLGLQRLHVLIVQCVFEIQLEFE
jgi:hypothetical protein